MSEAHNGLLRRAGLRALAAVLLAALAGGAGAEVREAAPDAAFIVVTTPVAAAPARVWSSLLAVSKWWGDPYTFSGQAGKLELTASAGGCLCERWDGSSAAHARVLTVIPERLLRLEGALGPLQEFPLRGVLDVWLKYAEDGSSTLDFEYRIGGASGSSLDVIATDIDAQLRDQAARLARYVETGSAELPAEPEKEGTEPTPAQSASRTAILEAWKKSAEEAATRGGNKAASPPPRPRED
ncbi:MAG: hypothetical protein J0H15_14235 [Xanthomonadales bacterium]|nr:hypothetical protein [Xanthomonadales bacterium]